MTLSTARVMIITLVLLVMLSWLTFIRFNGVVRGGDPVPGLPCEIPAIAGRAATAERWTRRCGPLRGDGSGERPAVR